MNSCEIDPSARVFRSQVGKEVMIREFCTVRNSFIGDKCKVYERVSIKKSNVGEGSDINTGVYIENADVGKDVQIAPNCSIVGITHEFSSEGIDNDVFERVVIGDGAWIGAGSIILPGVKIGKGAIVGAGAVVKSNIPDHFRYIGTPIQFRCDPITKKE